MVDWNNPASPVSTWFTVRECLFLPHWGRLATEADGVDDAVKNSLFALCQKMDHLREFFKVPIIVHCMYRPPEYSKLVGGTETDVHTKGEAIDFNVDGILCDDARTLIEPSLEAMVIRMEKNEGAAWIHIDIHGVGPSGRYFNP